MGRMDIQGVAPTTIEIDRFGGQNTAKSFSEIEQYESAQMLNFLPNKIGGIANRPGTVPLTTTALGSEIKTLASLRASGSNNILGASGTTLYKYNSGTNEWDAQTMTDDLVTDEIGHAQFKDENGKEVMVIADGGDLKSYDGTTVVDITPATDDDSPLPANNLATINTDHSAIGCTVHNTRVVIWDGSEAIYHSKIGYYDYFPNVDYQRFVRENDYVQNCISYGGALMVVMRRGIGALFGEDIDNWSQDFLDTKDGCIAPKTVQMVTYPNGTQEVFYLGDDGVHAIYTIDTLSLDSSARYSTRSVTREQIKWDELGVTKAEWKEATAYFKDGQYWLIYKKGDDWQGLVFDAQSRQWHPIDNVEANSFYDDEDYFYFTGEDGHLKVFDADLFSDYDDAAKSTKTTFDKIWYGKLLTPGVTGYAHMWDILMIEARQFQVTSSIDVEVNTFAGRYTSPQEIKTANLIWGEMEWGEAQWANPYLTDSVNNAKRLRTFIKGQYAQVKLSNDRDEPIEVFSMKYEVRKMVK